MTFLPVSHLSVDASCLYLQRSIRILVDSATMYTQVFFYLSISDKDSSEIHRTLYFATLLAYNIERSGMVALALIYCVCPLFFTTADSQ